jgi:hypothetical protein
LDDQAGASPFSRACVVMGKDFLDIDGILLDPDIAGAKFVCDLAQCKGACCTITSELSAALLEAEIGQLEKALPIVKQYLPRHHIRAIDEKGFWETREGVYRTRCLNRRDCVFVYYDGDIAKCSIERAYSEGRIDFLKPLSCHLFPITISGCQGPVLRFERYWECKSAMARGMEQNMLLVDFCQGALRRAFGAEWFEKLKGITSSRTK